MDRVEDEFGAFGTIYYGDDGRTLGVDPVRAGAALPARLRAAGGPAVRGRDARHLRLPRRRVVAVGAAVALPRRDRRGARPRRRLRSRRSPTAMSRARPSQARFREHRTVFPADFLGDFGFRVVRTSGRVGLARLELGGLVPVEEGTRAAGAAGGEGGVPAGAGAGAAALELSLDLVQPLLVRVEHPAGEAVVQPQVLGAMGKGLGDRVRDGEPARRSSRSSASSAGSPGPVLRRRGRRRAAAGSGRRRPADARDGSHPGAESVEPRGRELVVGALLGPPDGRRRAQIHGLGRVARLAESS